MERQFTATAYILFNDRILLHFHAKLRKWLPPGGHLEKDETPPECAIREALEETGLEIEIIREEHLWLNHFNAASFERPFMCLLENIPEHNSHPAHQHIDFIYLARPIGGELSTQAISDTGARWFTHKEVIELKSDSAIFKETQDTINLIFQKSYV